MTMELRQRPIVSVVNDLSINQGETLDIFQDRMIKIIAERLQSGNDVDDVDYLTHFTSLHYAILSGYPRVSKFLFSKGANPHIQNCDDRTSLDLVAGYSHWTERCLKDEEIVVLFKSRKNTFHPWIGQYPSDEYLLEKLERYNRKHQLSLELGMPVGRKK
jgi:hypothetical protein